MLKAFQYGKIKSEVKEDSLTASVFQLMSYLPTGLMCRILNAAIYGDDFPKDTGELLSLTFWDKWKMTEEDNNSNFVEPDVFLSFEKINLIIEAKRWDDKQQSREQWETELQGYFNEYPREEEAKPIYLIALGGLHHEKTEKVKINHDTVLVYKCRWSRLLSEILYHKNEIEKIVHPTPLQKTWKRILEDLIVSFELHGFFAGTWFSDELRLPKLRPSNPIIYSFLENSKLWQPTK